MDETYQKINSLEFWPPIYHKRIIATFIYNRYTLTLYKQPFYKQQELKHKI